MMKRIFYFVAALGFAMFAYKVATDSVDPFGRVLICAVLAADGVQCVCRGWLADRPNLDERWYQSFDDGEL